MTSRRGRDGKFLNEARLVDSKPQTLVLQFYEESDSRATEITGSLNSEFTAKAAYYEPKLNGIQVNLTESPLAQTDKGLKLLDTQGKVSELYGAAQNVGEVEPFWR